MATTTSKKIVFTKLQRKHISAVASVEKSANGIWTKRDFVEILSIPTNKGIVALVDGKIVGFAILCYLKDRIYIVNMAHSMEDIDSKIINILKSDLNATRTILEVYIRDSCLESQLFLRDKGFKAVAVHHHWFDDDEDAYEFQFIK